MIKLATSMRYRRRTAAHEYEGMVNQSANQAEDCRTADNTMAIYGFTRNLSVDQRFEVGPVLI
jgi:hypothetical protein